MVFQYNTNEEDCSYTLYDYLRDLSGNNQITFETLNISRIGGNITARVTTPFMDSLEVKYNDQYVSIGLNRLIPHLKGPIEIKYVGEDSTYSNDFTSDVGADFYILCIHPLMRDLSPIECGHCRKNIPYYLLPKLTEKVHSELTFWERNYAAYDQLFYATGIGEISAHKMMSNISSMLNQKGLNVCRMLEDELNRPVYYYLYRFYVYGKHPKKCSGCGGEWNQPEDSLYDYKCNNCKIVADKL